MSDFGVNITIKKSDYSVFTTGEISIINSSLQEIKNSGSYEDSLGEPFQFSVNFNENSIEILLSEYWVGDETEEEISDFTDMDKDEAEKIIEILKSKLGDRFSFEIYHGSW